MTVVDVGDHYRSTGSGLGPGVYRVAGANVEGEATDDETGDEEGKANVNETADVEEANEDGGSNGNEKPNEEGEATDRVTLLRVADADGRRVHTGEIRRVSPHTLGTELEPTGDPGAGFSPVSTVRNLLQGLYWSVRRFL